MTEWAREMEEAWYGEDVNSQAEFDKWQQSRNFNKQKTMGYNWNYNQGYQLGGYSSQQYDNQFAHGRGPRPNNKYSQQQSRQQAPKKHSGCKAKNDKNGNPCVIGWNYSRREGMRSFIAAPFSGGANGGTKTVTSGSGKTWENWVVKVSRAGSKAQLMSGMYCHETKKVIIQDLSFVMNPNAPNGGYVGAFFKRKN